MTLRNESTDSTPTTASTAKTSSAIYEADLRRRIATFPRDALAWFALGKYLRSVGRLREAEEAFRKTVSINPLPTSFWEALALTLVDLGRIDEAYTICDQNLRQQYESIQKRVAELRRIERSVESEYPIETSPCIACPEYTYYGCSRSSECDAIVRWRSAMANIMPSMKDRS